MSEAESNRAMLAEAYRRWHETRGGNVDELMPAFAPDARLRSVARGAAPLAFTREGRGPDAIRAYFDGLLRDWRMEHFVVEEMIAERDRVVVLAHMAWINRTTGKRAETRKVDILRLRDGKVAEFEEFYDVAAFVAAATT